MVAVARPEPPHPEERLVIHGVTWSTYVVLRDSLDDQRSSVRLTYLEGAMEIMSPSDDHEASKKIVARLVEAFAEESDLRLDGYGSTTFRKESVERGLEPDECYALGPKKEVPDVAIEIVISGPKIDKLAVYRGLGVPEVWIFRDGAMTVHVLGPKGYRVQKRSALLPDLDLELLASFVRSDEDQTKIVKAFRAQVRKRLRGRAKR